MVEILHIVGILASIVILVSIIRYYIKCTNIFCPNCGDYTAKIDKDVRYCKRCRNFYKYYKENL